MKELREKGYDDVARRLEDEAQKRYEPKAFLESVKEQVQDTALTFMNWSSLIESAKAIIL